MNHSEKWYQRRLAKYFTEHYAIYEDDAEFLNDPSPNRWLFDIPGCAARIELVCHEDGIVTEHKYFKVGGHA